MTPVARIARVSHPLSSKEKWLLVITYFDAGGEPSDRPTVCLAGVVTPETKWKAFEKPWNKILRRYGLEYMHTTDFYARKKPPFSLLTDHEHAECEAALAGILKRNMIFGSVHCITVKDWTEIMQPHCKTPWQTKRSWFITLMHFVLKDIRQTVKLPPGDKMACVFDRDKTMGYAAMYHYDTLLDIYGWRDYYGSITVVKDEDNKLEERFVPLQAADMVAHTVNRHYAEVLVFKKRAAPDRLFANLTAKKDQIHGVAYPRSRLERIKKVWPEIQQDLDRRGIKYDSDPNT